MTSPIVLFTYCILIVAASLLGGWVPLLIKLTHRRMEIFLSFVSGVMLGIAVLHLLPHALMLRDTGDSTSDNPIMPVVLSLLVGFLFMFLIERFFCFHHHDVPQEPLPEHGHKLRWTGAAIGLTVHGLVAGMALGASVKTGSPDPATDAMSWTAGLSTFLAIVLHKPFDSMTLGTLMAAGQRSAGTRHLVNALFGLVVPLGVVLFLLGVAGTGDGSNLVSLALAFSAGVFLCIALSDLLPELQFHQHDRLKLSAALLLGVALAWGVSQLETGG